MKKRTDKFYDILGRFHFSVKYPGDSIPLIFYANTEESPYLDRLNLKILITWDACVLRFEGHSREGVKGHGDIRLKFDEFEQLVSEVRRVKEETLRGLERS